MIIMVYYLLYILVGVLFSAAAHRLDWFENFHDHDRSQSPLGPLGIGVFSVLWPLWSIFVGLYYLFMGLGISSVWISKKFKRN